MRTHIGHRYIWLLSALGLLFSGVTLKAEEPIWTDRPVRIDRSTQQFERIPAVGPRAAASAPTVPSIVIGKDIKVIDAANFITSGRSYRIAGIAGLEPNQICRDDLGRRWACGVRSRATLRALLQHPLTRCVEEDADATPITISCTRAGRKLADYMIDRGIALRSGE